MSFPLLRRITAIAALASVFAGSTATLVASAAPPKAPAVRGEGSRSAIPDSYVVKLKDSATLRRLGAAALARALATRYRANLGDVWQRAFPGFAVTMTRDAAVALAAEADVEYIMQDQYLANAASSPPIAENTGGPSIAGVQTPVTWGLDRIDQHARPLDNHYAYDESAGQGVRAYILSTGILATHPDLAGRVIGGGNFIPDGRPSTTDCHGAGTRIAGVVGGTQFGVAKLATLVSVRMSNCNNVTSVAAVVSAFDWVISNAVLPAVLTFTVLDYCIDNNGQPAPCAPDVADALINAQESAFVAGIPVFGAGGDSGQDACDKATGAAPDTVYLGGVGSDDARMPTSNFGPCITMFAPAYLITTDDPVTGTGTFSDSGFAAAFGAGAAALFAGKPEFAGATPTQIRDELVKNRSTPNVITGLTANTPNRLLFTGPPGFFTIGESASLVPTADGVDLFGTNNNGRIQYRHRTDVAAVAGWTPWTHSQTKGWLSVSAEPNADGRVALAGLTPSGEIWLRAETTANSDVWSNWTRLNGAPNSVPIGRVAIAHNLSNRLQIFATTHQGQAYYRSQLTPGSRQWSAWTQFSFSGKLRHITAVRQADGRIQVLAVDDAGAVWRTTQTTPTDTNWSPFSKLNGFGVASIAAARHTNGSIELIGVDAGGGAWRRTQTTSGTWGDWSRLHPKTLARVTAEAGNDGRIQIVGVDNLGNVWHSVQTSPNAGTYSPWILLDGHLRP